MQGKSGCRKVRGEAAMEKRGSIKNADELEFTVFCIENTTKRLGKNAEEVYQALAEKSDILNSYIIPEY